MTEKGIKGRPPLPLRLNRHAIVEKQRRGRDPSAHLGTRRGSGVCTDTVLVMCFCPCPYQGQTLCHQCCDQTPTLLSAAFAIAASISKVFGILSSQRPVPVAATSQAQAEDDHFWAPKWQALGPDEGLSPCVVGYGTPYPKVHQP